MPARIASRLERRSSGSPSIEMVPRSGRSMPKIDSASSVRPAPSRPVSPSVSPLRMVSETSSIVAARASGRRPSGRPASARAIPGAARFGRRSCRSSVRSGAIGVMPAVGKTPTSLPSRSTVTRLEISSTSASRWLTKTTAMPSAESVRTMSSRRSVSDLRQRRGRLVHEDDLRLADQRPGDGDDLALGDRESAQAAHRRRGRRRAGPERSRAVSRIAAMIDQPRRAAEHSLDADILGDGHFVETGRDPAR